MTLRSLVRAGALGALTLASAGCASAPPPPELVAARTAYVHASSGAAQAYAPVELDNARVALAQAEQSFRDHGGEAITRDLGYVAERRSLQAAASGQTALARRRQSEAQAALAARQAQLLGQTAAELGATREVLAATSADATASRAALETERRARAEAERTAAAAVASLREVGAVREEARGMVITLSGEVLFTTGTATLLPIARQRLDQVAQALREQGDHTFVVQGHTDSRGSAQTNEALSLARASAVRDYLVSQGVPADRIRAEGLGPMRPVADNSTAEGRANNRRVEIVVQPATPTSRVGGGPAVTP